MTEPKPTDSTDTPLPPHPVLDRYYPDAAHRGPRVQQLFDASAPFYDVINRMMSFGSGQWYRQRVLLQSGLQPGHKVLDVGCGTGMIARLAADIVGSDGQVIALDPSPGMLRQAIRNGVSTPVLAVGERLPFTDGRFDLLSMGYALRHVADLTEAFREYRRVLKPGGQVLLLEITPPRSKLAYQVLKFYLKRVVPLLSRLRGNREAQTLMSYYWDTIEQCVPPEAILAALNRAGFEQVERQIDLGIFSNYRGRRPTDA